MAMSTELVCSSEMSTILYERCRHTTSDATTDQQDKMSRQISQGSHHSDISIFCSEPRWPVNAYSMVWRQTPSVMCARKIHPYHASRRIILPSPISPSGANEQGNSGGVSAEVGTLMERRKYVS